VMIEKELLDIWEKKKMSEIVRSRVGEGTS
jgi:hypothetical protein